MRPPPNESMQHAYLSSVRVVLITSFSFLGGASFAWAWAIAVEAQRVSATIMALLLDLFMSASPYGLVALGGIYCWS